MVIVDLCILFILIATLTFKFMRYILPIILASVSIMMRAQTFVTDTIVANELKEVVIEAPKVVYKADMDAYYPSQSAVENAKNGVQLLSNLMIPSISVTEALGTITSDGKPVQVRINGRVATVDQVRNLLPETIKRVEWIENPGLRYKDAHTVINFVVQNPEEGGSLMLDAFPALNIAWGEYRANGKFNSGRSQFEVGAYFKLVENLKTYRDYIETFTYPDGTSTTRKETPRGGRADDTFGSLRLNYNYIKPDTTVFVIDLHFWQNFNDRNKFMGLMSSSNGAADILLTDESGNKGSTPSMSVYLEQHLAHSQTLVVDANSQFYFGRSYSDYIEENPEWSSVSSAPITDIHTNIKDRNQAYAIEADYIKKWKTSHLVAGASYTANRNRSLYENLDGQIFHQRQDNIYFFAEYFHRINQLTLSAGLGAQNTDILFIEKKLGSNSWNLRPQASVAYFINQKHNLKLNLESWQASPSLAETNPIPQQIDGFQWRIGNPYLRTSGSYQLVLRYNFQIPRVYGQLGACAFISINDITPLLEWQGDKLITMYENSRGLQSQLIFLSSQIEIIPSWLKASGYIEWKPERMRGTGYTLTNRAWSGNVDVQVTHWGFTLRGQYYRARRILWGEKISWGEEVNMIDLSYNMNAWMFSAGCIMPFGRYDRGSKSLNHWNTNEQHTRLDMRVPYLRVSYNLQWGRQKRGANKLIDAGGSVNQSTAGGR